MTNNKRLYFPNEMQNDFKINTKFCVFAIKITQYIDDIYYVNIN